MTSCYPRDPSPGVCSTPAGRATTPVHPEGHRPGEVIKLADYLMAKMGGAGMASRVGMGTGARKRGSQAWPGVRFTIAPRRARRRLGARSTHAGLRVGRGARGARGRGEMAWGRWPPEFTRAATLCERASIWGEADPPRTVDFSHHPHRMGHVPRGIENRLIQCTCDKLHWAGHIDGQLARSWVHSAE